MSRAYSSLALALCVLCSCADRENKPPPGLPSGPPPLPTLPSPVKGPGDGVAAEDESEASKAAAGEDSAGPAARTSTRAPTAAKSQAAKATAKPKAAAQPASVPASAANRAKPVAAAPTPAPAPNPAPAPAKPATRVTVPNSAHVHPELPSGLQRDLDADPRMQSWLDRAFAAIDSCHSQNRAATGTIEIVLTMHENERPDADIRSLPPALSALVACSTGALMRTKMPLFTGAEGTRYTTRIRFD